MWHKGKVQLTFIIVAPPDQVVKGDRIFEAHAKWMEETHHRGLAWIRPLRAMPTKNPTGTGASFY